MNINYPPRRRQWHPTPVLLPGKSHGITHLVKSSIVASYFLKHIFNYNISSTKFQNFLFPMPLLKKDLEMTESFKVHESSVDLVYMAQLIITKRCLKLECYNIYIYI